MLKGLFYLGGSDFDRTGSFERVTIEYIDGTIYFNEINYEDLEFSSLERHLTELDKLIEFTSYACNNKLQLVTIQQGLRQMKRPKIEMNLKK